MDLSKFARYEDLADLIYDAIFYPVMHDMKAIVIQLKKKGYRRLGFRQSRSNYNAENISKPFLLL